MLGKFNGPENIGRIREEDTGVKKESERKFIEALIKDFVEFAINDEYYLKIKFEKTKEKIPGFTPTFSLSAEEIRNLLSRYGKNKNLTQKHRTIIDNINYFLKGTTPNESFELELYFNDIFKFYDEETHNFYLKDDARRVFRYDGIKHIFPLELGKFISRNNPDIVFLTVLSAIPYGIVYKEWAKNIKIELNNNNKKDLADKIPLPIFKLADAKTRRALFGFLENYLDSFSKSEIDFLEEIEYILLRYEEIRNQFLTQNDDFLLEFIKKLDRDSFGNCLKNLSDDKLQKMLNIIKKESIFIEKAIERYAKKLYFIKNFIKKGKLKEPIKIGIFDEFVDTGFTLYSASELIKQAAEKNGISVEIVTFAGRNHFLFLSSIRLQYNIVNGVAKRTVLNDERLYVLRVIGRLAADLKLRFFKEIGREAARESILNDLTSIINLIEKSQENNYKNYNLKYF